MPVYRMDIAGLERELPVLPVNDQLSIGAFVMFGDVELTIHAAAEGHSADLRNEPAKRDPLPAG